MPDITEQSIPTRNPMEFPQEQEEFNSIATADNEGFERYLEGLTAPEYRQFIEQAQALQREHTSRAENALHAESRARAHFRKTTAHLDSEAAVGARANVPLPARSSGF